MLYFDDCIILLFFWASSLLPSQHSSLIYSHPFDACAQNILVALLPFFYYFYSIEFQSPFCCRFFMFFMFLSILLVIPFGLSRMEQGNRRSSFSFFPFCTFLLFFSQKFLRLFCSLYVTFIRSLSFSFLMCSKH